MIAVLVYALLATTSAIPTRGQAAKDLALYRELQTKAWWTSCCGAFQGALPRTLERRIRLVHSKLQRKHGDEAVSAAAKEAREAFEVEFGLYDPVPRRRTAAQKLAEQQSTLKWYDQRLDVLEARLSRGKEP